VVVISIDTLRPDHMGSYGYKRNTTPKIDAFFKSKAVFDNASSPSPCTVPSVRQFLTGQLNSAGPSIAETLNQRGYQTAAIASQHIFRWDGKLSLYNSGYDHFDLQPVRQVDHHSMTARTATEVSDRALSWLKNKRNNSKPFHLWLHYFDPHDPYESPAKFRRWLTKGSRYNDGDRRRYLQQEGKKTGKGWLQTGYIFSDEDVDHFVARYDAEIAYTDSELGRVFEYLRSENLLDNTLVVLLSDHGEALGENDLWDHCNTLREVELRVPLMFNVDRAIFPPESYETPARTIDVAPTIFGMIGLPTAPSDSPLDGQDLRKGEPRQFVAGFRGQVAIKQDQLKLIAQAGDSGFVPLALYDLNDDPQEGSNLLKTQREKAAPLYESLKIYRQQIRGRQAINEEILKQLQAIGYTE